MNTLEELLAQNSASDSRRFPNDPLLIEQLGKALTDYTIPNTDFHSPKGKIIIKPFPNLNIAALKFEDEVPLDSGITLEMLQLLQQGKTPSAVIPPSSML